MHKWSKLNSKQKMLPKNFVGLSEIYRYIYEIQQQLYFSYVNTKIHKKKIHPQKAFQQFHSSINFHNLWCIILKCISTENCWADCYRFFYFISTQTHEENIKNTVQNIQTSHTWAAHSMLLIFIRWLVLDFCTSYANWPTTRIAATESEIFNKKKNAQLIQAQWTITHINT